MAFGDVKTPQGVKELNKFLADNSYISGYTPSKADLSVFDALGKAPTGDLVHVQRWYRHIASFEAAERAAWGGAPLPQVAGAKPTTPAAAADDDDDIDLFGSDEEEDAEAAKIREERVAAYAAKKSTKPALIAKSSVLLDVKPWDDETDMKEMEKVVRTIEMDGLLWGASKLVPVGYGINKLQIMCVIEDEKVSIDLLTEQIQEFEDFVQSVDIAAFNKI
ncbi:probable elongation factor 1-beta [Teleopsis dalmanni]|uniref:probable elongation factor 1-beta n=1 Tax=Teleopsis dalmanni TaxID=139649 RepID=UPI000D32C8F8|nr:probable elongation factor 1-beta [Teleopsis dalmanni]XP_037949957.1 probable elongation factor 1-beta [Teleopsis dalmanni]XP_037952532.1 probable elongation factor 1-beta [Teleopsis dalmanni]XP_037952833.1 probable elongation factor 1-beta [Teleopsis dalmanni]